MPFIEALTDTYRYMLASRNGRLVSLVEELRALEHHHLLAATRYGGLTRTEIIVDPTAARHLFLPPVSLGELLQNALKHNEVTRAHPLVLQVSLAGGFAHRRQRGQASRTAVAFDGRGTEQSRRARTAVFGTDADVGEWKTAGSSCGCPWCITPTCQPSPTPAGHSRVRQQESPRRHRIGGVASVAPTFRSQRSSTQVAQST